MDNINSVKLTDLVKIEIVQRIQEDFFIYTGMPAVITDENGIPLIERAGENADFCFKYTRKTRKGDNLCRECDKAAVAKSRRTGNPQQARDVYFPISRKRSIIGVCGILHLKTEMNINACFI